jgi:hypothetical protein
MADILPNRPLIRRTRIYLKSCSRWLIFGLVNFFELTRSIFDLFVLSDFTYFFYPYDPYRLFSYLGMMIVRFLNHRKRARSENQLVRASYSPREKLAKVLVIVDVH